jgi:hypothetical protein
MAQNRPVLSYKCPQCGQAAVFQHEDGPKRLLEWEDTLWNEVVFECSNCEWTETVGRVLAH